MINGWKDLKPFKAWCVQVLPSIFDESMSYYECLCKMVKLLNDTMNNVDLLNTAYENFTETTNADIQEFKDSVNNTVQQLQNFVSNYFDNLDVQEEIDNKLDNLVTDGTFNTIISPIVLNLLPPQFVESVSQMTNRSKLYVLKSSGHIYQWGGSAFVDTGVSFGTLNGVASDAGVLTTPVADQPINTFSATSGVSEGLPWPETALVLRLVENYPFELVVCSNGLSYIKNERANEFYKLNEAKSVNGNQDMNELLSGLYIQYGTSTMVKNAPKEGSAAILIWNDHRVRFQLVYYWGTGELFKRIYQSSKWGNWINTRNITKMGATGNLNDIDSGDYLLYTNEQPENSPINDNALLVSRSNSELTLQYAITLNNGLRWVRRNLRGTWSEWKWVDTLSVAANNADLNDLLAGSVVLDYSRTYLNAPPSNVGGILRTDRSATYAIQTLFDESGVKYRRSFTRGNWNEWINEKFTIRLNGSENIDTLKSGIYTVYTDAMPENFPSREASNLWVVNDGLFITQYVTDFVNGLRYSRRKVGNNEWSEWVEYNVSNYKMLSVGNSILGGSIWKNGSFFKWAIEPCRPFNIIGQAIGIRDFNNEYIYNSGAGIIFHSAGVDNFVTAISKYHLRNYACLLTHFYVNDMTFNMGDIDSVKDDGTLMGGIVSIMDQVKSQNRQMTVIILGCVPVSYEIKGENVFTGNYPNGKSLTDLDNVMKLMAKKYHFHYISFDEWRGSYYYQDYTDGNNVHANNPTTYQQMGAYAGGKASSYVKFHS